MRPLKKFLDSVKIKLVKFDPSKVRCITLTDGQYSIESFAKRLLNYGPLLSTNGGEELPVIALDVNKLRQEIVSLAEEYGVLVDPSKKGNIQVPEEYKELVLNMDISYEGRDPKFIVTNQSDRIVDISGSSFIRIMGFKVEEAVAHSRKIFPEYDPRGKRGVSKRFDEDTKIEKNILNTYVPPSWRRKKFSSRPGAPVLFKKLVKHLIPIREEREFFYDWLHASLYTRAYTYLILCGGGGIGKNRLKLVMRALHGHQNTVDGKKSTLTERFNSQLSNNTLTWFDELHYNQDMENVMKELQNDSIAIERNNFYATRSSKIYSSFVISNNKPRDNYIAFDARKFVPLQLTKKRLETSMTMAEIDELTKKVEDPTKPEFDPTFIAKIGVWLKERGQTGKWPLLEYKGPMFYKLAHTSMSRWQKKAATVIMDAVPKPGSRIQHDKEKGFLWSTVEDVNFKKGDKLVQFPDYTSIKYFFDIFVEANGDHIFETVAVGGSMMGDFWVKCVKEKAKIYTESEVMSKSKGEEAQYEDESYDL